MKRKITNRLVLILLIIASLSINVFALNETDVNLTMLSPASTLSSGEDVYLSFTTSTNIFANYSLNDGIEKNLGTGAIFTDPLEGSLDYNILENGEHNISITIWNSNSSFIYDYSFEVSDNAGPVISLKYNSTDANNSLIVDTNNTKEFTVSSDEYATFSYSLNENAYSSSIDFGNDKTEELILDLIEGKNNLSINTNDFQGNSGNYYYTFDFSYPFSCSDGILNGYETGIDCGSTCGECIELDLSTNKAVYEYGEEVLLIILSRANSVVNITTLFEGNIIDKRQITGYSPNYPIFVTTSLDNLSSSGEYIVNAVSEYMGNIETESTIFYVNPQTSSLSVNINADATTIDDGGTISFTSAVTGSVGTVSYKWDFGNDGSIESYSSQTTRTYKNNGTFKVNLTITDDIDEVSDIGTITVKELFNITVTVKNNSNKVISEAVVELDNEDKETDDDGIVSYLVNPGEYDLEVRKDGFNDYYNDSFEVKGNMSVVINLSFDKDEYPVITLISPEDDEIINNDNVDIVYEVDDNSNVDCSLELYESGKWETKKDHIDASRNNDNEFTLESLSIGTYSYRIICEDEDGNVERTSTMKFYIDYENELYTLTGEMSEEEIDSINDLIDNQILEFEKLSKVEKEVFEALQIRKELDDAKELVSRQVRDLKAIVWRKVNESEERKLENEIYEKIREIRDNIPTKIYVFDSKEFVDYPREDDINEIIPLYIKKQGKKVSSKEEKRLLESYIELQSFITVTTKAKKVEIEFYNGNKEKITLVEKTLKFSESNELELLEYIPKEIAEDVDDIKFLFEHTIIEKDPLVKINPKGMSKFIYYIKDEVNLDDIKKTKTLLIDDEGKVRSNLITGYSIFDRFGSNFDMSTTGRIIIEILIIIVLAGVYVGYSVKDTKWKYYFKDREALKKIKKIDEHIANAEDKLFNNNYQEAKEIYKQTHPIFQELPSDIKKETHTKITILSNKIDSHYINKLLDKAMFSLENNDKTGASTIYKEICDIYSRIAPDYKAEVLKRCNELREKL